MAVSEMASSSGAGLLRRSYRSASPASSSAVSRSGATRAVTVSRDSGSFGDARRRLSKLRPPPQTGAGAPADKVRRKDQGYLRVDENLLKNDEALAAKLQAHPQPISVGRVSLSLSLSLSLRVCFGF